MKVSTRTIERIVSEGDSSDASKSSKTSFKLTWKEGAKENRWITNLPEYKVNDLRHIVYKCTITYK